MKISNICDHTFLENLISNNSCIVDCGVNHGEFSTQISKKWSCKIHGLEPDPRLFKNLPKINNCQFHQLALSDTEGSMKFNLGESMCSSLLFREEENSQTVESQTISLPRFCEINRIDKIDLLKLDIEGAEIQVLKSLKGEWIAKKIIQITVEFHEFLDQTMIPEIEEIIEKLKSFGFYYLPFSRTYGDVLFVNSNFIKLSSINLLNTFAIKYIRGVPRLITRKLAKN